MAPTEVDTRALLSLSLEKKAFRVDLSWLIGTGAKPAVGTEHLYEPTTSFYLIPVPPWMAAVLGRQKAALGTAAVTCVGQLLGNTTHHPKADILGSSSAYRPTVHRLRQSLPALALKSGTPRMHAALALCQTGLVSPGRVFYGAVTGAQIVTACEHNYRHLGWLFGDERLPVQEQLVGARVVATPSAIRNVFKSLAESVEWADKAHCAAPTLQSWVVRHRAIVAFIAATAEFCLCLRDADCYVIDGLELISQHRAPHINDKKVHPLGGGPAAGKPDLLMQVVQAWCAYLGSAQRDELLIGDVAGERIAVHAAQALELREHALLFNVDIHGDRHDVGDDAWLRLLPTSLRLVENFGRHFWPKACHDRGLGQRHLDYLLRHRLHAWEHLSNVDPVPSSRVRSELVRVLNAVIGELQLDVPAILRMDGRSA